MKTKAVHPTYRAALTRVGFTPAGDSHMQAPEGLTRREARRMAQGAFLRAGAPFVDVLRCYCGCGDHTRLPTFGDEARARDLRALAAEKQAVEADLRAMEK